MLKMARTIKIQMSQKGDFKKTFKFLKEMKEKKMLLKVKNY